MKTKFKNILIGITFLFSAFIFAEQTSKKVYVVPIQDVIDLGIPGLVTRAINLAETDNASLIIFDIDTFGGRVDAATQIKDAISSTEIETIAFINRRAISAGIVQVFHPSDLIGSPLRNLFQYLGMLINSLLAFFNF